MPLVLEPSALQALARRSEVGRMHYVVASLLRANLLSGRVAGTKRVREVRHGRARASTGRALKPPDVQAECVRECLRVDARSLPVVLS